MIFTILTAIFKPCTENIAFAIKIFWLIISMNTGMITIEIIYYCYHHNYNKQQ